MAKALAINDEKNYITPQGFAALQAEFHALFVAQAPRLHVALPAGLTCKQVRLRYNACAT